RVDDSTMAGQRWIMIDTKGRKRGTKVIESKKFKTTRRKAVKVSTTRRGKTKLTETTIVKGGTYQRQVPFPLRLKRSGKTVNRGVLDLGTGEYDEPPALFRTKFRPGAVEPVYITRDHIAPVLRKEMTRVVENAYRRAFLKIKGRGI
ncbi:MAG: hypothetical protein NWE77_01860, partial [Candidatus Bathyarchaeota archaeon]|nr:hypothetical protein [Candidatus Bathyarchaeota archaeon]